MNVKTDLTTLERVWDILDECGLEYILSGNSKLIKLLEGKDKNETETGIIIAQFAYMVISGMLGKKKRKLRELYETITGEKNTSKKVLEVQEVTETLSDFFIVTIPKLTGLWNKTTQVAQTK